MNLFKGVSKKYQQVRDRDEENAMQSLQIMETEGQERVKALREKARQEREDENNPELKSKFEKFINNFKDLQSDIKELGDEDEITRSLSLRPDIFSDIVDRATKIGGALAFMFVTCGGSAALNHAIETGDYRQAAITLGDLAAASVGISSFIELISYDDMPGAREKKKKHKIERPVKIEPKIERSPKAMIFYGDQTIDMTCKHFETDGVDDFKKFKKKHPDEKFIFTSSHNNNNDVPALLKTFGRDFDLQITGNELFFEKAKYLAQNLGVKAIFGDHFTKLGQKESGDKKEYGVLRPENFVELDKKMAEGRTPWIAAHSFSADGSMRKVDNGALIEAYRQNAYLIPSALEITGGAKRMQGVVEIAKNFKSDSGAKYHVGTPYKPEPLPNGLNIDIINQVITKRQNGEIVSDQEFEDFKTINHFLSIQSEKLGRTIAAMLPEEQRGYYKDKSDSFQEVA